MNIKELKKQIADFPDHMEVFIRAKVNPFGNIIEAGSAEKSTYGFFGKSIDCVIIEPEKDNGEE